MTDDTSFRLSRRKVLAGLGTIGIASAGAGLGTTAFLSDEEQVSAELEAGRLDLLVDYRATYNPWLSLEEIQSRKGELLGGNTFAAIDGEDYTDGGGPVVVGQAPDLRTDTGEAIPGSAWAKLTKDGIDACVVEDFGDVRGQLSNMASPYDTYQVYDETNEDYLGAGSQPYVDGPEGVMFRLTDVKPKDEGEATISLHLCDNPGYVSLTTLNEINAENGVVEPESSAGDSDLDTAVSGELANYVHVTVWPDADCSNTLNGDEVPAYQGSLAGFLDVFSAETRLAGDLDSGCFSPGAHCVAFQWYVLCEPTDFDLPSDVQGAETIGDELDAAGLPRDVNVVQTDSVEFSLVFDAVQCRHNMSGAPSVEHVTGDNWGKVVYDIEPNFQGRVRQGVAGPGDWELGVGPAVGVAGQFAQGEYSHANDGSFVPFEFAYDSGAGEATLTYDVGGANETTISDAVAAPVAPDGKVGFTVSGSDGTATAEARNVSLVTNSTSTSPAGSVLSDGTQGATDHQHCVFLNVPDLDQGFTLSGELRLEWTGTPSRERPALHFHVQTV